MISRPAASIVGCNGCRTTLFRAIAAQGRPRSAPLAMSPRNVHRPITTTPKRFEINKNNEENAEENKEISDRIKNDDSQPTEAPAIPWFLEEQPPQRPTSQHIQALPQIPNDSPEMLESMLKYIFEDMGLDDISMLDLRELDPAAALGPNLIMLFGTARSETHLHVSAGRFVRWLRKSHKINAKADGLIGPGELKTKLRRLRKKAKLMGTNTAIVPRGDNGISTGWICVNFLANEEMSEATASFDDDGRVSGFGSAEGDCTIVVQCMTEARRSELNLETLWQGILKKSITQGRKFRGEDVTDKEYIEKLVREKVQLPKGSSAQQWQSLMNASESQKRYYSTSARRLETNKVTETQEQQPESSAAAVEMTLQDVERQVLALQITGAPLDLGAMNRLIFAIFNVPSSDPEGVASRLALVDQLLLSCQERGLGIWKTETLVTLIEDIVSSPDYGETLKRSQKNFEYLMTETRQFPDKDQQLRLMVAYASRQDWERFWDVFRIPARLQEARSSEHYELAFRAMTATGNSKLCTDALRWVYPEMLKEEPRVLPVGALYRALKECILTADPMAQQLSEHPPSTSDMGLIRQRQMQRREFVRVLREVEDIHRHTLGEQAREERVNTLNRFAQQ